MRFFSTLDCGTLHRRRSKGITNITKQFYFSWQRY